jgi:hypothetical protein
MSNYGANNNNSLIKVIPMTPEKSRTLGTPWAVKKLYVTKKKKMTK